VFKLNIDINSVYDTHNPVLEMARFASFLK